MTTEQDHQDRTVQPGATTPSERVHPPLLTLITQQSLDQDYLVAAERRAAGVPRAPRGRSRRVAAVVIAAFGLLVSTAYVQTSRNADVNDESRATLISRLQGGRDLLALQQQRVAELRADTIALEESVGLLADIEQESLVTTRRLQIRTGFIAVTGPGVRIVVTDRPDADRVQLVQDSDLALLVNGLWEAGAEAVAVNGQRLTGRTAIRTSGQAIEVNDRGIAGPYTVEAIGDTRTLSARLFDTASGLVFVARADFYGFTYVPENVAELSLPSGPSRFLIQGSASTEVVDPEVQGRSPAQPELPPTTPTDEREDESP